MHSNHRRELLAGGTAFVACCLCHSTTARAAEAPQSFDMIAYCKSTKPLFNCSLQKCATKRGLKTCAHCPDFPTCKDEQWSKYPKLRETAEAMRPTLAG